ncbi:MAG: segregation/condensation protein A [Candidatus Colwellbacteria bacterium]|nr:segregation/condensation protein A [Candidatus Colwellbacteria bacterium]
MTHSTGLGQTEYEFSLGEFKGPLEKLLELIEERELEITRLSLAEVTADFLKYLESLTDVHPRVLADFVAVAAKLILVKSQALLPQLELAPEEEKEIAELESRLEFLAQFRGAEREFSTLWGKEIAEARDYFLGLPPGFYFREELTPADLEIEIKKISSILTEQFLKTESVEVKLVSLEEKIAEVLARVDKAIKTSFNEIARGRAKEEVVVFFLALLHLLKERLVEIEQGEPFSEITVKTIKNNGRE